MRTDHSLPGRLLIALVLNALTTTILIPWFAHAHSVLHYAGRVFGTWRYAQLAGHFAQTILYMHDTWWETVLSLIGAAVLALGITFGLARTRRPLGWSAAVFGGLAIADLYITLRLHQASG